MQGDLLAEEFPAYREHSFEHAEIFGHRAGFIRHFEWVPPDGVAVTQLQLYYAEAGRGYTATATTPRSLFPRYESELREVLQSLLIESLQPA